MADGNPSGEPLETVADSVGEGTIEALELLASETRLAILLALWESIERQPPPSVPAVSFSALRERVGIRHGQQFNYHLSKLEGRYVTETDEGYRLTPPAAQILQTVLAGTLTDPSFEGGPIDEECSLCGAPMVVDYDRGVLGTQCTSCDGAPADGTSWGTHDFPPAGLEGRRPEEVHRAARTLMNHRLLSLREGVCPICAGRITSSLWVCADHDAAEGIPCEHCGFTTGSLIAFTCDACKYYMHAHPYWFAYGIPAVRAFFHDHGSDLVSIGIPGDALEYEVRSVEPPELRLRVELDDGGLEVTIDEAAEVVDVTESTT